MPSSSLPLATGARARACKTARQGGGAAHHYPWCSAVSLLFSLRLLAPHASLSARARRDAPCCPLLHCPSQRAAAAARFCLVVPREPLPNFPTGMATAHREPAGPPPFPRPALCSTTPAVGAPRTVARLDARAARRRVSRFAAALAHVSFASRAAPRAPQVLASSCAHDAARTSHAARTSTTQRARRVRAAV